MRMPAQAHIENAQQQHRIGKTGPFCGLGKILVLRDLRIRICFQDIDFSGRVQATIDSRIPAESERAIDALREILRALGDSVRKFPGLAGRNPEFALVFPAPFDTIGRNPLRLSWHLAQIKLPDR